MLQDIYSNNGLTDAKKEELKRSIDRLEAHYFGEDANEESVDLDSEVHKWARQSRIAFK